MWTIRMRSSRYPSTESSWLWRRRVVSRPRFIFRARYFLIFSFNKWNCLFFKKENEASDLGKLKSLFCLWIKRWRKEKIIQEVEILFFCCLNFCMLQLFIRYEYGAQGRPRFGVSLGLFVDCLNTFSVPGHSSTIEIRYPGPDMQLLLKYVYTF